MKRIILNIILLVSFIQIRVPDTCAQERNDYLNLNSSLYRESFHMFTDRTLYAAGEMVLFRLFNLSYRLTKEPGLSKVIYLELINSQNMAVAQGKYLIDSKGGDGGIAIPDTLSTGHYYLRAYTRWMRNFPPSGYCMIPLSVVNPEKISMADLPGGNNGSELRGEITTRETGIACSTDKHSYGKREKVTLQLNLENRGSSPDGYCISVVKKGFLDESFNNIPYSGNEDPALMEHISCIPETRGSTIAGTVVRSREGQPAALFRLGMTLLGSNPDHIEFVTDENGRFHVSIPRQTGVTDALLTVDENGEGPVEILMDEEFASDFSPAPVPAVDYFREQRDLVEDIMVKSQLWKAFESTAGDSVTEGAGSPDYLFYGTPEVRYRTDDYITLPNLEEFMYEIIPEVHVEDSDGKKTLAVLDDQGEVSDYAPLILLDNVPLPDMESILSASPRRIDHIDIVNRIYIRGTNTYGGIVSIITTEGDRAGVGLPEGSTFISLTGLYGLDDPVFPDYGEAGLNARIPDLRYTLFWSAHQDIPEGNGERIGFYTSDLTGEYTIIVRGLTDDGELVTGSCEFIVE